MEKFFMVFVEGGQTPQKKQSNLQVAREEAKRLCKKTGKTAFVLEAIGGYHPPEPEAVEFILGRVIEC